MRIYVAKISVIFDNNFFFNVFFNFLGLSRLLRNHRKTHRYGKD